MLITVSGLLSRDELADLRDQAAGLRWRDGAETAGAQARRVKRNEQADLSSRAGAKIRERLLEAISTHPVVSAAAQPMRFSRPLLSRAGEGGGYGLHVDNALMGHGEGRIRSDVSYTLFLTDPDDYAGGELVIEHPGASQTLKPPAGDLVLYPSTSLHRVNEVRAGSRLAAVGWIQSRIRDSAQRELVFDLENLRTELAGSHAPESPEMLTLSKTISNLVRMWAEA